MESVFIKAYVLISLWFWAGILLSAPLRKSFGEMHLRVLKRIYDATLGQVVKAYKRVIASISKKSKDAALYMEDRTYELRAKVARKLVSKKLLNELTQTNLVSAISRAKQIDQYSPGISYDDTMKIVHLGMGKPISREAKRIALKKTFEICNTDLFKDFISKVPRAQERILLAFDQTEGNAPYDAVKNEEFRKFIRE